MKITDRDLKLLGILGGFGVVSTAQVNSLAFKNIRVTTVLRRLRILRERNLIREVRGLDNGALSWALTTEGATASGQKVPQKYINKNTLRHDVTLSQLRMSLQTVGLGEKWQPEHVIRRLAWSDRTRRESERGIVPDGLFVVQRKDGPKTISVELELTLKSMHRYDEIFKRYTYVGSLWVIWYFVPTHLVGKSIMARWHKTPRSCELGYTLLSEALNNPWEMTWHFKDESILVRRCVQLIEPFAIKHAQAGAHSLSMEAKACVISGEQIPPRIDLEIPESLTTEELPSVAGPTLPTKKESGVCDYRQEDSKNQEIKIPVGVKNNDAA